MTEQNTPIADPLTGKAIHEAVVAAYPHTSDWDNLPEDIQAKREAMAAQLNVQYVVPLQQENARLRSALEEVKQHLLGVHQDPASLLLKVGESLAVISMALKEKKQEAV